MLFKRFVIIKLCVGGCGFVHLLNKLLVKQPEMASLLNINGKTNWKHGFFKKRELLLYSINTERDQHTPTFC